MIGKVKVFISFATGEVESREIVEELPMTNEEYLRPYVNMILQSERFQREVLNIIN